jgi:chitinase
VLGYYLGYQSTLLPPDQIPFEHLTHIAVGSVLPQDDGSVVTNFYADNGADAGVDEDAGASRELAVEIATKAHEKNVVPLLMVGGWDQVDGFRGAASSANRDDFVINLLAVMDDLGYDGLDLMWVPFQGGDQSSLKALVDALREARPNMVITLALEWTSMYFGLDTSTAAFYSDLASSLDQMNIMSYGMAGAFGSGWNTWHSSALKGHDDNTPTSVEVNVDIYEAEGAGIPAAKLGAGAGFFGQCWTGGVTAPNQAIESSSVAAEEGAMSYAIIQNEYYDADNYHYHALAEAPYLGFTTPKGSQSCTYISYEDTRSIAAKVEYIKTAGLGGISVWTIPLGYLPSEPAGSRNPLLKTIADNLLTD